MIVLGMGSNVGDRLANLRNAYQAIAKIPGVSVHHVSPVYLSDALLPENAPPEWDMPHLNLALGIETQLEPLALLDHLKKIEKSISKNAERKYWGPRIIDIDILAWEDRVIRNERLKVPHENLQVRPFALWPLADVMPLWQFPLPGENYGKTAAQLVEQWGSRLSGQAPFRTRQLFQRIDTPRLVGVINVTPDSFSDGGHFVAAEKAVQQAIALVEQGAEVIDVGAESTSPKAEAIDAETEWARLEPILMMLNAMRDRFIIPPKISVDTRRAEIAAKALQIGVDWINDVSGLDDPAMREIILDANVDCVAMHHICIPERRDNVLPRAEDPVKHVKEWGMRRLDELEKLGIPRERIIFDPGIGFGKLAEQSLMVLRHLDAFSDLNTRILIGHSRKTFFSLITGVPFAMRDVETLGISFCLAHQNVDYLRIHNVEMCARAFKAMKSV